MSGAPRSNLETALAVDSPLVQNAAYRFNATDRQFIDNQILALQAKIVSCLLSGVVATYRTLDPASAACAAGDCVVLSSLATGTVKRVTSGAGGTLALAGVLFGILLEACAPGGTAHIAIAGHLSPTLTGLAASAQGHLRVNATTARLEKVTSLSASDFPAGFVDVAGFATLLPSPVGYGVVSSGSAPAGAAGRIVTLSGSGAFEDPALDIVTMVDGGDDHVHFRAKTGKGIVHEADVSGHASLSVRANGSAELIGETSAAVTAGTGNASLSTADGTATVHSDNGNVVVDTAAGGVTVGADSTIALTAGASLGILTPQIDAVVSGYSIVRQTSNNRVLSKVFDKVQGTSSGTKTLATDTVRDNCVTRLDVTVTAVEEGTTNHASWTLRNVHARNSAGAPNSAKTVSGDTVLEAIGSNSGSPPATWACILDLSGNDWRVRLTLPAANVQAQAVVQLSEATNSNTP